MEKKFIRFPDQVAPFERKYYLDGRNDMEKEIYLTCPVASPSREDRLFLADYTYELEKKGVGVYYPGWDTEQNKDPIGTKICDDNARGIKFAKQIHKYLHSNSPGSIFDDGMAFAVEKSIKILNKEELENFSEQFIKDFTMAYCYGKENDLYKRLIDRRNEIKLKDVVEYQFWGKTPEFLFDFGMAFMLKKPIILLNRKQVPSKKGKSFENILLTLDAKTRGLN